MVTLRCSARADLLEIRGFAAACGSSVVELPGLENHDFSLQMLDSAAEITETWGGTVPLSVPNKWVTGG